ncbi:DUF4350 domain-containing protein [Micromonospora endolithica]|uniref:DUF4350 domain-containing protein n=1 Tax=Micromonospora endolithica TaxID=230091 RepID=A0A3A9YRJ4_9ACTN|nr:DUF4350 domain-containing protein [Micromonospora endolithica]RKN38084.1 DUF4350 domain-containing protein [Micromonospora endolithica]TWJ23860.1 hypothetical protein JD76_04005 [Micromonospora endolithica]
MTATASAPGTAARPRRRRHRILLPLGLAALLLVTTLVTHAVDQPDPDGGFLSPVSDGPDGGSRLAEALRARGVTVQRETDTQRAVAATRSGPVTLFVPAPDLLHPRTVPALRALPDRTRLVLVDPPRRVLLSAGLSVAPAERRWAARAVRPEARGLPCPLPELAGVGQVAVGLQRWALTAERWGDADFCFADHLVRLGSTRDTVLAGGSDPFRNARIDEWDNRAFATALLGGTGRVVWLDLDGPAPAPTYPARPPRGDGPADRPAPPGDDQPGDGPPGDGYGDGYGDGNGPGGRPGDGQPGDGSGDGDGSGRDDGSADGGDPPNPLWNAFPGWFWALLLQLLLAALLAAVWRARRLGPPSVEPLPVSVPAAETVLGRAHLYQRAGARDTAARTLRAATLTRLLPRLNLPADAHRNEVVVAVAARTGDGPQRTDDLLYGPPPESDQRLLELARSLDRTARTVAPHPGGPFPPSDAAHPHRP